MWNLLRTIIIALAFAGFLGQSMARATPFPVAADTVEMSADCAEMMVDPVGEADHDRLPCDDMTPDCIAKMGCAAVSPVLASGPTVFGPLAGSGLSYSGATTRLDGTTPSPLRSPPKPQL
ncbi:MAG: hypothetical protein QME55_12525 [Brevundimonas sp.]|uniref:hypothetical protein n=1 Tax=Brevundimonas sp. TaxID=1871086 RepID=UPI0026139CA8|nr:hypothetical protein [Brevundimonas sp.]MDI6625549.1 hypothetical protein [Brevundimonas sp.]MDQ7812622.1 hypothetical protein [Brevundimonas sp.]